MSQTEIVSQTETETETETPGYGQGTATTIHRTREDGAAYCGAETVTVGCRSSALDLIQNHGYDMCTWCAIRIPPAGQR